jgi:hypothetical protein
VAQLVRTLTEAGVRPFVVPAMGTHGGASPAEQEAVLAHLGVSESLTGAPVVCRGEVVLAGETAGGIPVWVDAAAWAADAVIPVNRVKPHTAFRGSVESGPSKMLAVGLGKAASAEALHRAGLGGGIPEVASFLLATGRVPFGVALVEDPFGALAAVRVLAPTNWLAAEAEFLALAWTLYPRLPWDELDLLVVERMGKDLSGTGMDLNVIGMKRRFPAWPAGPRIGAVVALRLTQASRGNATGIGYADLVTQALAHAVDWEATRANCRATGFQDAGRCPRVAADEAEAVALALADLAPRLSGRGVRAARLTDTLHLGQLWVSPALADDLPPSVHRACG